MRRNYLLVLIVLAISASTLMGQAPEVTKKLGYLVGPGDKIEGKVLGEEQFGFMAYVDENGNFFVPFDEEPINAKCRTEREIRTEVTKRIAKYVRNPMVSVFVSERRKPIPVTVYGEVRNPRQYELYREARLMELIASSGGVNEEAGGIVRVFRPQLPVCAERTRAESWREESNDGLEVPSRMYSLSSIQTGKKESNPIVYPGDIVVVEKAAPVYFTGEVNTKTGVYIKEGGLSLTQAIAMVGGVRERAKIKDVRVYRKRGNNKDREIITVDLVAIKKKAAQDIMLEPYDIIDVGRKKKSIGEVLYEVATGAIRQASSAVVTGGTRGIVY